MTQLKWDQKGFFDPILMRLYFFFLKKKESKKERKIFHVFNNIPWRIPEGEGH